LGGVRGTKEVRLGRAARLSLLSGLALVALMRLAVPAHAAFPGANGRIAFVSTRDGNLEIYTMNADGSAQIRLTNNPAADVNPNWSPDGTKIAFTSDRDGNNEIYSMNADGNGQTRLTADPALDFYPAWSPGGTKIAFTRASAGTQIYTMNADGSAQTNISNNLEAAYPNWSPDGTKIAFATNRDNSATTEIYTMKADGTNPTRLTSSIFDKFEPNWSPDGQRIVFTEDFSGEGESDIIVMNADGSNQTDITNDSGGWQHAVWSPDGTRIAADDFYSNVSVMSPSLSGHRTLLSEGTGPDWQPLIPATYHHPQTASSLQVSLVPAFKPCGTGGNPSNAKHAPPLATNSCNPPRPSVLAAVGATSQSSAQMTVLPGDTDPTNGNQANVAITASLTDIQAVAGGDYNPNASGADLTAVTRLRLTDKANGYGGLPATATEYDFKVPIDCSATPDPITGSICTANTTANALVPGLIQEQQQAVVQAFRVRIDDSGTNGIRGDSDDRIFATQGVFIP
jgi:dipeptidyl aminopeptidase/acylaminoacyl peptidase